MAEILLLGIYGIGAIAVYCVYMMARALWYTVRAFFGGQ